jgi:hypothetical protein
MSRTARSVSVSLRVGLLAGNKQIDSSDATR